MIFFITIMLIHDVSLDAKENSKLLTKCAQIPRKTIEIRLDNIKGANNFTLTGTLSSLHRTNQNQQYFDLIW